MNKKLFTLMTLGLLAAGSAFNGVNAQTNELANGTTLDGNTWYFIGTEAPMASRTFLKGGDVAKSATDATVVAAKIVGLMGSSALTTEYDYYLWKVKAENHNGTIEYTFVNKGKGKTLKFNTSSTYIPGDENEAIVSALRWNNGATDTKYVDNATSAANSALTADVSAISIDGTNFIATAGNALATTGGSASLYLYTVDEIATPGTVVGGLNAALGDGFALSFPKVTPQPETNIFDQKIKAFVLAGGGGNPAPVAGTYFATSYPEGGINNRADFNASTFIAVSPTEHYGINALKQSAGVGFKFITVSGSELKDETSKDEVNVKNAIFTPYFADPVNKPNEYTLKLAEVYVKKDASKDEHSAISDVYADAITSVGVTYVTTTSAPTAQKLVISETNMVKAADILKTDAPALFNIQFVSGADKIATGSEYGKFLGLNGFGGYKFFAEAAAYLNLDAPQNQWVITAVDGKNITFSNRDNSSVNFTAQLRKTDTSGVYEMAVGTAAGSADFSFGYTNANGYVESTPSPFAGQNLKVNLIPATIDLEAGFANYTDLQLSLPSKIKFTISDGTFAKNFYVKVNNTTNALEATEKPTEARSWYLIKNTEKVDSVKTVMTYAYQTTVDGAVKVKTSNVPDKAIGTYKIATMKGNNLAYLYYGASGYEVTTNPTVANKFLIKENVNGTVSLIISTGTYPAAAGTQALVLNNIATVPAVGPNVALVPNLSANTYRFPEIMIMEPATSLEAVSRRASFQSVNGGFLAVGADRQAVIAPATEEAVDLTFWLDTVDVEEAVPSFYISQSPSALKADAVAHNYLWNPIDSAYYYDSKTASYLYDIQYYYNNDEDEDLKAVFKSATDEEVAGDDAYKFQITLADEDVADEYIVRSVANGTFLANINGKLYLTENANNALVVTLGEGDPTANDAISAEAGVQVIGGQGVVTVQGAAGKVITIANILGQTIANQVAASDNVTIAAPAGVVVVAVDGDATKVVVK